MQAADLYCARVGEAAVAPAERIVVVPAVVATIEFDPAKGLDELVASVIVESAEVEPDGTLVVASIVTAIVDQEEGGVTAFSNVEFGI